MQLKFLFVLLLWVNTCHSQYTRTRFPIGNFNKDSTKIIGISTGLVSFGDIHNKTIGLHFDLYGLAEVVHDHFDDGPIDDSAYTDELLNYISPKRIYGINISGLGLWSRTCDLYGLSINGFASVTKRQRGLQLSGFLGEAELLNGVQLSGVFNCSYIMNGVQITTGMNIAEITSKGMQVAFYNKSKDHTGLQIGIINRAAKLKGIQVGLWNISGKRKLPIINW